MFADINSLFYNYIRGGIFILTVFHFINYIIYRKTMYAYYSGYFLALSFFFFGETIRDYPMRLLYSRFYSNIHLFSYICYIGFARHLLETKKYLPKWDKYMLVAQKILLFIATPLVGLSYLFIGPKFGSWVFFAIAPMVTIFSIVSLIKIAKIRSVESKYFVIASFVFIFMANLSLAAQIIFGPKKFLMSFHFRAMIFTYIGAIIEAFIFAYLIGAVAKEIERKKIEKELELKKVKKEKNEIISEFRKLESTVVKSYILLKNKSKIYLTELYYIQSDGHYLNLFTKDKKEIIREKMTDILHELPPNFVQIHRTFIVNINHIERYESKAVFMNNKAVIPLSRSKKELLENKKLVEN